MPFHEHAPVYVLDVLGPILVGLVYVSLMSLLKEPHRRQFMAIMIAGAGPPTSAAAWVPGNSCSRRS